MTKSSLYGGQFTLSTPLIKPNFCIKFLKLWFLRMSFSKGSVLAKFVVFDRFYLCKLAIQGTGPFQHGKLDLKEQHLKVFLLLLHQNCVKLIK